MIIFLPEGHPTGPPFATRLSMLHESFIWLHLCHSVGEKSQGIERNGGKNRGYLREYPSLKRKIIEVIWP